jgi:uncharacterized protein YkwD
MKMLAVALAVALTTFVVPTFVQGAPSGLDQSLSSGGLRTAVRLDPPKPQPQPPSPIRQVLDLVNAERAARGLPAMVADQRLDLAAQRHSEDQASMRRMSHTGSDGSTLAQRIDRVGFPWRSAAENVAYGYASAAAVMTGWMNSTGHRLNILSSNTHIGVGLAYTADGVPYWTQVFATPR